MIRFGSISELDATKGVARVRFEEDDIVSDWLRVSVPNSASNKDEKWYDVGEHVWCLMDEHSESGLVGGSYYHEGNQPPVGDKDKRAVTFSDGTKIVYDRAAHKLTVECVGDVEVTCKNAKVTAETKVTIDSPDSQFTGDLTVDGDINASGISASGNIESSGSVKAVGQVEALSGTTGVVRLSTHMHATAAPGPPSPPTPGT